MSPTDAVLNLIDALAKLQIPYMFVGSYSSNIWGKPRSTNDADLVIELGQKTINDVVTELSPSLELESQMTFETITATRRHRLFLKNSAFKIELFFLSDDPHDKARFERRIARQFEGRSAFVASAEDVIIMKLRWSRSPKRGKDLVDAKDVLQVRLRAGDLDIDYIRHWCDQHGTRELFEQLMKEAEPPASCSDRAG